MVQKYVNLLREKSFLLERKSVKNMIKITSVFIATMGCRYLKAREWYTIGRNKKDLEGF